MVRRVSSSPRDAMPEENPPWEEGGALPATLERLEDLLQIDQDAMEEMCASQPDHYYKIAKTLALHISRRDEAKQKVQEAEAAADYEIRQEAADNETKVTEKQVASDVLTHPKVKAVRATFNVEQRAVGQLTALKEAFQQRSYMLNNMTELYITGYFGQNVGSGSKNKIRDRNASEAKEGMKQLRREYNERRRDG